MAEQFPGIFYGMASAVIIEVRPNAFAAAVTDALRPAGQGLTGYGMEEDIARGKAAGFVTHLIKPVTIQSLETALAMMKSKA